MTESLKFLAYREKVRMFTRAEVRIVYYFRDNRRRDPDNYSGKFLIDSLRHAGILADDDAKSISLPQPEFRVDSKAPRTEIELRDGL